VKAWLLAALALLAALPSSAPLPAAQAGNPQGLAAFDLSGPLIQGGLVRGRVPDGTLNLSLGGKPVPITSDGRFILGFDRDQPQTALLVAQREEAPVQATLTIMPRTWQVEHLNMRRGTYGPSEAYKKRRDVEVLRIAAARAITSPVEGWNQRFVWPARGRISGQFGSQRIYRGGVPAAFHSGVDIAPGAGALVVAPADGVVVLAGPPMFSLEGNLVIIDHGLGMNSAFLHLASTAVREGQVVKQGDMIGTVGASGRATGPHLHWSVMVRGSRIDPARLIDR
jgi:hypothetical protein